VERGDLYLIFFSRLRKKESDLERWTNMEETLETIEGQWAVESVLKRNKGGTEYLVRWSGRGPENDSWISKRELEDLDFEELVAFEQTHKKNNTPTTNQHVVNKRPKQNSAPLSTTPLPEAQEKSDVQIQLPWKSPEEMERMTISCDVWSKVFEIASIKDLFILACISKAFWVMTADNRIWKPICAGRVSSKDPPKPKESWKDYYLRQTLQKLSFRFRIYGTLRRKVTDEVYGRVTRAVGNGKLLVLCFDGCERLCEIRGGLRVARPDARKINRKNGISPESWIVAGDVVLVSTRNYGRVKYQEGDVIHRYNTEEGKYVTLLPEFGKQLESGKPEKGEEDEFDLSKL